MKNQLDKWASFDELLTWATWYLMEAITRGEPLRRAMHHVLSTVRSAEFEKK